MPKMKYPSSYSKKKNVKDETHMSGDYYEPFAGYQNSVNDQSMYWDMVTTPKGVVPQDFMSKTIPMANDVGKKNKKGY